MNEFDLVVETIARALGLEGASLLATLAVISLVARLIGKRIPDDKTGWVGFVRDAAKIIGLYTSNRVTSGVSVTDVSKVLLDSKLPNARDEAGKFATQTVEDAARLIK
jgi:hypothetical protein